MTPEATRSFVLLGVSASAVCLAAIGGLLLFAPTEAGTAIGANGGPAVQLLGAALLGFGAMNWIARGSILGGIYGRAVLGANQTHFTIGALLLVKHGFVAGGSPAFWLLTAVYVLGAVLFGYVFVKRT